MQLLLPDEGMWNTNWCRLLAWVECLLCLFARLLLSFLLRLTRSRPPQLVIDDVFGKNTTRSCIRRIFFSFDMFPFFRWDDLLNFSDSVSFEGFEVLSTSKYPIKYDGILSVKAWMPLVGIRRTFLTCFISWASRWAPHNSRRGSDIFLIGATLVLASTRDTCTPPAVSTALK